jgi:uncharacterized protein (DUF697 family)
MKRSASTGLSGMPVDPDEIAHVREQCRRLVRRRAAISAGVAALPVPGIDILSDLSSFALLIEEVSKAFGLTPSQIERMQPKLRLITYEAVASIGGMLVGKLVTRELVMQLFKRSGARLVAKSAARIVPIAGQVASAAIGFAVFRQMGYQHVEACARVAQEVVVQGSVSGSLAQA